MVIPIWKEKGDRQDCNNYREIILIIVLGKVLAHFLLMLIRSHLLKHLTPEQPEFKPSKSTTNLILALRILVKCQRKFRQEMFPAYVDLKKVFDSMH